MFSLSVGSKRVAKGLVVHIAFSQCIPNKHDRPGELQLANKFTFPIV